MQSDGKSLSKQERPIVGITMGDPSGIGPELSMRVLADEAVAAICHPVVFGDWSVLEQVALRCGWPKPSSVVSLDGLKNLDHPVSVVDCGAIEADQVEPGRVSAVCGRAAFEYIRAAIDCALAGDIAAIATAPIHKEAIRLAGVPYPGHTELFTELTKAKRSCMMLASDKLIVSFVTCHTGLIDVPSNINPQRVQDVIELTAQAVRRIKGSEPKIAVLGLNPHAGEHGLFGTKEEQRLIEPAIQSVRCRNVDVHGPLVPDAAFLAQHRNQYDAFVCMYHDQGHIPFKMLAFDTGVNITLGLPIIRVSVDHGTAFDIAWQGKANPQSMIQAVSWSAALAKGNPVLL